MIELTSAKWRNTPLERGVVITVETTLAADLPPVHGNAGEIREALTNLVLNAVDAMPQGGKLRLATRAALEEGSSPGRRLRRAVVEVSDTGIGMDEETRRRCLEPFFTTKGERGSGLGLPMVFGVAERHGGALEIDSELGAGTTVRLLFPAVLESAEAAPAPAPAEDPSRGWRILVVDDDPTLLETLIDVFEGEGHQVVGAGGGAAAIELRRRAGRRQALRSGGDRPRHAPGRRPSGGRHHQGAVARDPGDPAHRLGPPDHLRRRAAGQLRSGAEQAAASQGAARGAEKLAIAFGSIFNNATFLGLFTSVVASFIKIDSGDFRGENRQIGSFHHGAARWFGVIFVRPEGIDSQRPVNKPREFDMANNSDNKSSKNASGKAKGTSTKASGNSKSTSGKGKS